MDATTDLAVWLALVLVQILVWGSVAYINLGVLGSLDRSTSNWINPATFVVVGFIALALPLAATAMVGIEIVGTPSSSYVGGVIQIAGFVSAIPAMLVIYHSRTISHNGVWGTDVASVQRIRSLQAAVRVATLSLGLLIAIAIIATTFVRDAIAQQAESFAVEPQHVLLYGGFFTGFVFALYLYGRSAIQGRAEMMVDDAMPTIDLNPHGKFLENEASRKEVGAALGLGTSARESFENIVIVTSPLLSAVVSTFIAS